MATPSAPCGQETLAQVERAGPKVGDKSAPILTGQAQDTSREIFGVSYRHSVIIDQDFNAVATRAPAASTPFARNTVSNVHYTPVIQVRQ